MVTAIEEFKKRREIRFCVLKASERLISRMHLTQRLPLNTAGEKPKYSRRAGAAEHCGVKS